MRISHVVFPSQCFFNDSCFDDWNEHSGTSLFRTWYHAELGGVNAIICAVLQNLHELCENTNFTGSLWLLKPINISSPRYTRSPAHHLHWALTNRWHSTNKFSSRHLNSLRALFFPHLIYIHLLWVYSCMRTTAATHSPKKLIQSHFRFRTMLTFASCWCGKTSMKCCKLYFGFDAMHAHCYTDDSHSLRGFPFEIHASNLEQSIIRQDHSKNIHTVPCLENWRWIYWLSFDYSD